MTHTLHRRGSVDSLRKDYVILCTPAKGVNHQGATRKLLNILEILMDVGPANIGFYGHGNLINGIDIEEVKKGLHDNSRLRCCFDDREKLKQTLRRIKSEDLGLSITVSGLIAELVELSKELQLEPHTINISCGTFGRVDQLPPPKNMEISTMCGHGMICYNLVESVERRLLAGSISIDEAIRLLSAPCTCGIFNPSRAREILIEMTPSA